jgi:hypothetical protein
MRITEKSGFLLIGLTLFSPMAGGGLSSRFANRDSLATCVLGQGGGTCYPKSYPTTKGAPDSCRASWGVGAGETLTSMGLVKQEESSTIGTDSGSPSWLSGSISLLDRALETYSAARR